jgi:DNA-binding NtrC family response regulator
MEGWKVLLVDDEEDFVSTLAERLRLRGLDAVTAGNGVQALQAVSQDPPQVVVLDVMMPGMSGLQVLELIKRDHPKIQVLLLTGIGSTSEGEKGIQMGAFDFLMKPLQIEDLIQKIGEAIDKVEGEVKK